MDEKLTLCLVFVFSIILSSLFVLPFDQLLGEDPYFHREVTEFFAEHGTLPQNNTEQWEEERPYATYLTFKLKTYPRGFYYPLYPFYGALKYFPLVVSGLISVPLYLYLSQYSKEAGILAAILVHTPNFTAHSILLLPEVVGLVLLPLVLYLFERKYYLAGILLGILSFIHPFSALIGYLGVVITGAFKKEIKNFLISLLISFVIVSPYAFLILQQKTNVGYQLGFHLSTEVYSLQKYLGFFGVLVISPIFLYLSIKKKDYIPLVFAGVLMVFSVVSITRVPPERFFAYLSIILAIIVAKRLVEIKNVKVKHALVFSLVFLSFVQNYWIFGAIGPAPRETASWEFLHENSLENAQVLGWDRYPQIFTTERRIYFSDTSYTNYKEFDYVSPDANVLARKKEFLQSLEEDKIYDNKVGLWHIEES